MLVIPINLRDGQAGGQAVDGLVEDEYGSRGSLLSVGSHLPISRKINSVDIPFIVRFLLRYFLISFVANGYKVTKEVKENGAED